MTNTKSQDEILLERITIRPDVFGGKPIIRNHRIAVEHILGQIANGATTAELLEGYPFLGKEDIQACLVYAHRLVTHEHFEPTIVDE